MEGHDCVVAIMGGFPSPDQYVITNYSDPARQYIPAMQACGINHLYTVMGAGFLGPEKDIQSEWLDEDPNNAEMVAINKIRRDMSRQWDMIKKHKVEFTIWCPANYPAGPVSDEYITGKN